LELHGLEPEQRLEGGGGFRTRAELGRRAGPVELGAAPFETEQRDDGARPRIRRRGDAGVEWIRALEPVVQLGAQLVEPGAREDPAAGLLDPGEIAQVREGLRPDRLVHRRSNLAALDQLHALEARVAGRRRVEHAPAADRGCGAKNDTVATCRDNGFRQAKLGETVADPNDAGEDARGSVVHVYARWNLRQRFERDVQ